MKEEEDVEHSDRENDRSINIRYETMSETSSSPPTGSKSRVTMNDHWIYLRREEILRQSAEGKPVNSLSRCATSNDLQHSLLLVFHLHTESGSMRDNCDELSLSD